MTKPILEACVESLDEAIAAEQLGADRIELCSSLQHDGLTPSYDLARQVIQAVSVPVKVMIRSRPGNFEYSLEDIEQMHVQLSELCKLEISGIVFGALSGKELNIELISEFAIAAGNVPVTVHKCIDDTSSPVSSVTELLSVSNVRSILTSGGAPTALEGQRILIDMQRIAGNQIRIIAAGRITIDNLPEVHSVIKAKEYHGRRIVGDLTPGPTPWDSRSHNQ